VPPRSALERFYVLLSSSVIMVCPLDTDRVVVVRSPIFDAAINRNLGAQSPSILQILQNVFARQTRCRGRLPYPVPYLTLTAAPSGPATNCKSACARLLKLWVRIPPGVWMSVYCDCFVLLGRGLCDALKTRPEKSYRL